MNYFFTNVSTFIQKAPVVQQWSEMKAILGEYTARSPLDWTLPVVASKAVGGTTKQALPAAATIACMQINLFLIDDLLDKDPRGWHHKVGVGGAANLAAAFRRWRQI